MNCAAVDVPVRVWGCPHARVGPWKRNCWVMGVPVFGFGGCCHRVSEQCTPPSTCESFSFHRSSPTLLSSTLAILGDCGVISYWGFHLHFSED